MVRVGHWGRIIGLACVLPAGMAQAVIDPCHTDAVIARAAAVIQIVNVTVSAPDASDNCTIAGEVARVFRGGRMFHVGDEVQTLVSCAGDPEVLCGSIWYDPADIAAAGAIEIHVEGDAPVGAESVLLLDGLTEDIVWRSACGN
jgi:hypothetical protein